MSLKSYGGDKEHRSAPVHSFAIVTISHTHTQTHVHCDKLKTKTWSSFRTTWYVTVIMAFNRYFPIVDSSCGSYIYICMCLTCVKVHCMCNSKCITNVTQTHSHTHAFTIVCILLNCTINSIILPWCILHRKDWKKKPSKAANANSNIYEWIEQREREKNELRVLRSRWHTYKRRLQTIDKYSVRNRQRKMALNGNAAEAEGFCFNYLNKFIDIGIVHWLGAKPTTIWNKSKIKHRKLFIENGI